MRLAILLLAASATLAAQSLRIEDTFADGNSQNHDLANHSFRLFNGRANTNRSDAPRSVRFSEIGTSSEGFWIHFTDGDPITLLPGDRLTAEATFRLHGFQHTSGQDIRFGIFDSRKTRNAANLTGGVNSTVFSDDIGYGAALFASGTGWNTRTMLDNDTSYTLRFTVERIGEDRTRLTVSLSGEGLEDYTHTAIETSPNPNITFDWFGLRIISNAFSSGFTFTRFAVTYLPAPPITTTQPSPQSLTVSAGANVQFFAGAQGTNLSFQWRRNAEPLAANESARTATLRLLNVQSPDSGAYDVVVSNEGGSVTSYRVTLTVVTGPVPLPPSITTQPRDTTATAGLPASLSVIAAGISTGNTARLRAFRGGSVNTHTHVADNRIDSNVNGVFDPTGTGAAMILGQFTLVAERFDFPLITGASYERVLDRAGASLVRDAVDNRIVNAVRTQTGAIIDSQSQAGGYPSLNTVPAPQDSDRDGIPDGFEHAIGLSPTDPNDAARTAGNGYTYLENYLNSLVP